MAVMEEQDRQRSLGMNDFEVLRTVSEIATDWARQRALELGQDDAIEVGNSPTPTYCHASLCGDDDTVASLAALSCDSMSLSSDDASWVGRLFAEDLIPDPSLLPSIDLINPECRR
jgi:hypothetical protein